MTSSDMKKTLALKIKAMKEKQLVIFFGNVRHVSNKYFKYTHKVDEDNIIINTNNVRFVKGSPTLVVGNNDCVYLKEWNIKTAHNYDSELNFYVIKLSRQYFKTYTFGREFVNIDLPQTLSFDDLLRIAEEQDTEDMPIALSEWY